MTPTASPSILDKCSRLSGWGATFSNDRSSHARPKGHTKQSSSPSHVLDTLNVIPGHEAAKRPRSPILSRGPTAPPRPAVALGPSALPPPRLLFELSRAPPQRR